MVHCRLHPGTPSMSRCPVLAPAVVEDKTYIITSKGVLTHARHCMEAAAEASPSRGTIIGKYDVILRTVSCKCGSGSHRQHVQKIR